MDKHQLIKNRTGLKVFDTFNEKYSEITISLCDLLSKFQIIAISIYDSKHIDDIRMEVPDPFGCFIGKNEYDASSTYAEIVINEKRCEELKLSNHEMYAAIAHEVGHVIFFFKEDKENIKDFEEIICDYYACLMGLAESLVSLLNKLIRSGDYSQDHIRLLTNRKKFIDVYKTEKGDVP